MIKKQPDYIVREWNEETRKNIKKKSGIYSAYLDRMCIYVGASKSLDGRVGRFFTEGRRFDNKILGIVVNYCKDNSIKIEVRIYFHDASELRGLEFEYIKKLHARLSDPNNPYRF